MFWPGTNYNTIAWFNTKYDFMFWCRLPFVTLSFGYRTKCYNILARYRLPTPITAPNVIPLCRATFAVPNVKIMIDLILVTGAKCVSRLFVYQSSLCHTVFKRSSDNELNNPSGTPDGRGVPLEQNGTSIGNSKTRTLPQQLTIIYF